MISRVGLRMPLRNSGTAFPSGRYTRASHDRNRQKPQTNMNWTRVRVTGLGKAMRMALEEVLDRIEVAYQMPQRNLSNHQLRRRETGDRRRETGEGRQEAGGRRRE